MRRVYLLQPDNMPLKTVMKYGEERDRACEINAAFVARTRSHAELIYLRHLHPTDGSGNLDFSKLWHEDEADVNQRSLERTERIAGFLGDLGLDVLDDGVKLLQDGELPKGVGVLELGLLLEVLEVEGLVVYVLGAEDEEVLADEGFEFGFGEVH